MSTLIQTVVRSEAATVKKKGVCSLVTLALHVAILTAASAGLLASGQLSDSSKTLSHKVPAELTGYNPTNLIRFRTLSDAEQYRKRLIKYIWPMGLPSISTRLIPDSLAVSSQRNAKALTSLKKTYKDLNPSITLLAAEVTGWEGEKSLVVLLQPRSTDSTSRNRQYERTVNSKSSLVIVHHGHRPMSSDGSDSVVKSALQQGHHVMLLHMPLVDWNADYPRKSGINRPDTGKGKNFRDHNDVFKTLTAQGRTEGEILRLFLEPIIQGINYFLEQHTDDVDVAMVGLSGGGWSTHLAAAVDVRIKASLPVAGALPLYARKYSKSSAGDAEQIVADLFQELDSPDSDAIPDSATGVASWLEVFALGGIGDGRTQIQILNVYDSCCFGGTVFASYSDFVAAVVRQIGAGHWQLVSDSSHRRHAFSPHILTTVIEPLLKGSGLQSVEQE